MGGFWQRLNSQLHIWGLRTNSEPLDGSVHQWNGHTWKVLEANNQHTDLSVRRVCSLMMPTYSCLSSLTSHLNYIIWWFRVRDWTLSANELTHAEYPSFMLPPVRQHISRSVTDHSHQIRLNSVLCLYGPNLKCGSPVASVTQYHIYLKPGVQQDG